MARPGPQTDRAHLAAIGRIALECRELRIRETLADQADEPDRDTGGFEHVQSRFRVEACNEERDREHDVEDGLKLEEREELEIEIAAAAPLATQLDVTAFLGLPDDALREMT